MSRTVTRNAPAGPPGPRSDLDRRLKWLKEEFAANIAPSLRRHRAYVRPGQRRREKSMVARKREARRRARAGREAEEQRRSRSAAFGRVVDEFAGS